MLLVGLTLGGTTHRVSNQQYALEHFYDARISSMGQIRHASRKSWGGYVRPTYGQIGFTPDTFEGHWPPPITMPIVIKLGTIDEATAETVFEGTAHRTEINREEVIYDLYGEILDFPRTDRHYTGTVLSVFTAGATTLGLTLDSSAARPASPAVDYTISGDSQLIDDLDNMAAFNTHFFYIKEGTLFLIDGLADNGVKAYTEFDIFPSKYTDPTPYKAVTSGDYSVAGSFIYADRELSISPATHTVEANVNGALAKIKIAVEMPQIELYKPLAELPIVGQKVTITDESLYQPTTAWGRVIGFVWDFNNEQCVVEGVGGIS